MNDPLPPSNKETRRALLEATKARISAAANLALKQPGAIADLVAHSHDIANGTTSENFTAQLFTELQRANAFLQALLVFEQ